MARCRRSSASTPSLVSFSGFRPGLLGYLVLARSPTSTGMEAEVATSSGADLRLAEKGSMKFAATSGWARITVSARTELKLTGETSALVR